MMKIENTAAAAVKDGGAATSIGWARTCDTCHSAASAVYCRADLAYLCTACDARIHAANQVASRHKRVWVCDSCERAPAAFLCKADSASLCAACDADIHSANPLARRHHRVPVPLIPAALYGGGTLINPSDEDEDEDEAATWLLLNPMKNEDEIEEQSINVHENGGLFGKEVDEYLDLDDYNQVNEGYNNQEQYCGVHQRSYGGDCVVPIQYSYQATMSQSVSLSSMDVGIVPESTTPTSEAISTTSHTIRPPKGTIDLFSSPPIQIPSQLSPIDREARVLRYREKKKNRKFEKTIRYASRKAYAETRPRIKGRFAKRTDVEVEVDGMFSAPLIMAAESAYGVVPSF